MMNVIGQRIKEIRLSLGYNQQKFADCIEVSKSMVSYLESGKKTPSRETVSKISNLANVPSDYIMGLSDINRVETAESSDVMLELEHYLNKVEKFDEETKEFAIKKIKALISGLDLENEK